MSEPLSDVMRIGSGEPSLPERRFRTELAEHQGHAAEHQVPYRVLELGCRRWEPDFPTHHAEWLPPTTSLPDAEPWRQAQWIKSDVEPGIDVDAVADAHDLMGSGDHAFDQVFDAYVAVSVYEHLARPWVAAHSAFEVLRPGGLLYVCTHHTFPLHGFPSDYWRFSTEALGLIFQDAGFQVMQVAYAYFATLTPPPEVTRWNPGAECPMLVDVFARKPLA
jgi:SAM-dependent methyltransferase